MSDVLKSLRQNAIRATRYNATHAYGGFRAYLSAILVFSGLFLLSFHTVGRSEVLFSLFYTIVALAFAVFVGKGPGVLAGILAALTVDYHYIKPNGVLNSFDSFAYLALSLILIQMAIAGVHLVQGAFAEAEIERENAMKAVAAREEILGIVAHDLRQPLSAIDMRAGLLQRLELLPAGEKHIAGILSDAKRLERMIGDLIDFAKIDSNQLLVNAARVSALGILKTVLFSFRSLHMSQEFQLDAPADLIILADDVRVQQILTNLISNAIKYGEPAAPIRISLSKKNGLAEFAVCNQGPGIPADRLTEIFDRFTRVHAAQAESPEGLGLGLYITKGLVEAQGGRIWAESQANVETKFLFTIPIG